MSEELREQFRNLESLLVCRDIQIKRQTKEIEQLNAKVAMMRDDLRIVKAYNMIKGTNLEYVEELRSREREALRQIEQLNAKVAMIMKSLGTANTWLSAEGYKPDHPVRAELIEAAYPSEADVTKFLNGVKAEALEQLKFETPTDSTGCFIHAGILDIKIKELRGE